MKAGDYSETPNDKPLPLSTVLGDDAPSINVKSKVINDVDTMISKSHEKRDVESPSGTPLQETIVNLSDISQRDISKNSKLEQGAS
ncbi:hypothetical protein V6N11_052777 [Hibiscus sabdariffa]|uniref:Uncharacterized protein n=1 Tax=Hibiscus sabdariffa TaxID=183260 RepID=A0ABR2UBB6_9ROSI